MAHQMTKSWAQPKSYNNYYMEGSHAPAGKLDALHTRSSLRGPL